jgi:hypothetical protein
MAYSQEGAPQGLDGLKKLQCVAKQNFLLTIATNQVLCF